MRHSKIWYIGPSGGLVSPSAAAMVLLSQLPRVASLRCSSFRQVTVLSGDYTMANNSLQPAATASALRPPTEAPPPLFVTAAAHAFNASRLMCRGERHGDAIALLSGSLQAPLLELCQ